MLICMEMEYIVTRSDVLPREIDAIITEIEGDT